jgi:hypothetical protein
MFPIENFKTFLFFMDLKENLCSDGVEQWVPYDNTNYCSTSAFDGASSILQEVYSSLKASGIVVEQVSASHLSCAKISCQSTTFDVKLISSFAMIC